MRWYQRYWLSNATHDLVLERIDFEPLGGYQLCGFDVPLTVWAAVGERSSSYVKRRGFIGRDQQLAELQRMWARAQQANGGVAGMGKSHLTETCVREFGGRDL